MRNYNCAFCQNHDFNVSKRNHKICDWKDCECGQCEVTRNLQKILRLSIALRRSKSSSRKRSQKRSSKYTDKNLICNEFLKVINDPRNHYAKFVQQMYLEMKNDILQVFYKMIRACDGNSEFACFQAQAWIRKSKIFVTSSD